MNEYLLVFIDVTLHVKCKANTDLNNEFTAICQNTGEKLIVKGWLIEEIVQL